jgi:hypothetical protein
LNWIKLLQDVKSIEALLLLVNDFVLQFPSEHWSWIPKAARPGLMTRESDIHFWHQRLVEAMAGVEAPNIRLQDLGVFFVRAAARAHELRGNGGDPSNDRHFDGQSNGGKDRD